MTTAPSPLTAATMLCAEIRNEWMNQPGNQRPSARDYAASMDWWQRWRKSEDKAECDELLSAALKGVLAMNAHETLENALAAH